MATYCFICSSWNIVDISLLHFRKEAPNAETNLFFTVCHLRWPDRLRSNDGSTTPSKREDAL